MLTKEELALFIIAIGVLVFILIKIRDLYLEDKDNYNELQKIKNIDTKKRIDKMNKKRKI